MFGPPGTGKTLAVKAAAKESGLPVAFISAADIMSKWQGESEVCEVVLQPGWSRPSGDDSHSWCSVSHSDT